MTVTSPTFVSETVSEFESRIAEIFCTEDQDRVKYFRGILEDYGIESEENLDDAYNGCFPSVSDFCENLVTECYSHVVDELPGWLQTAIDYEMIWHQSMQYDFFEIYDRDCGEYYFFSRNF